MQIELIGCTGAGKSTLIRKILHVCHEQGVDIYLGDDFVLKQIGLNWIKNHLLRTLLMDLAALSACLLTWRRNVKFYFFAARRLFCLPIALYEKINLLRNVLKKVGIFEIIRFRDTDKQIIMIDEGVLQAAHNLFVHVSIELKTEDLLTFTRLVTLPDAVVYLKQPEGLLIERTMKRGHKRIPDRSYGKVVRFVKQAVATFDKLVQYQVVENKLLVVGDGENVIEATNDKDDPIVGLFLKIIERGCTSNITDTPKESRLAPGLFNVPTPNIP
jgi:thymidylate kinase